MLINQEGCVQQFAVDPQLFLGCRHVANLNRAASRVSFQARKLHQWQIMATINPIHRLQTTHLLAFIASRLQPFEHRLCFLDIAQVQQAIHTERGITYPGIAVIPIFPASQTLWQACCGSSHKGPGGLIQKQLQHKRGTLYLFAPVSLVAALRNPAPPESKSLPEQRLVGFFVQGNGNRAIRPATFEKKMQSLSGGERKAGRHTVISVGHQRYRRGQTKMQILSSKRSPVRDEAKRVRFLRKMESRLALQRKRKRPIGHAH